MRSLDIYTFVMALRFKEKNILLPPWREIGLRNRHAWCSKMVFVIDLLPDGYDKLMEWGGVYAI